MKKLNLALIIVFCQYTLFAQQANYSKVPGTVVTYSPASSGKYIGSPSICILPNGDYVASHDFFGPESNEHVKATSRVFTSSDKGQSWSQIAEINGQFWSKLFVHQGNLYFIGTDKHHGNMIIRKSTDNGKTWTEPTDQQHGLIRAGEYHCAPMPVVTYAGKIWRAMEYAKAESEKWGVRYSAMMFSVPNNADLLQADNWQETNKLSYDSTFLNGNFGGWIEGNAVISPEGNIVDVLRVDNKVDGGADKAAIVQISTDGKIASFDRTQDFVDLPGGSKKFTIHYDSLSGLYWTISNYIPEEFKANVRPASIRNTQALCSSEDLKAWEVHQIVLQNPDTEKHGFNYVDWEFEGKDIVLLSRTAYDDGVGGAHNFHDANFLTFHRIKDFRKYRKKIIETL